MQPSALLLLVLLMEASDGVLCASGALIKAVCFFCEAPEEQVPLLTPREACPQNILTLGKSKVSEFKPCIGASVSAWFLAESGKPDSAPD